jgi:tetratricopeptide (TPR) repeat protein
MMKLRVRSVILFAGLVLTFFSAQAQLLTDTLAQRQIKLALDKIYNFEFATAENMISAIQNRYPRHPVGPMLQALHTFWKNFPIETKSQAYVAYQQYLWEALEKNKATFGEDTSNPEGIFFALSAHSYLAMMASEEKEYMKALSEAKKAYAFMKKGFELVSKFPEFYFSTGSYNYYVIQYPENHPVVKPFMFFFANGNKALGLQQMERSIHQGVFTRTEACYWLAHIYIKHEIKPQKALGYTQWLIDKYPANIHYVMRHAEMLVANGKYHQAQPYIKQLLAHPNKLFHGAAYIFGGIIQEKEENNHALARLNYQRAFNLGVADRRYTKDLYAQAYAGLARIADKEGNKQRAKEYYKKTLELAEYETTVREAKTYLKNV